MTNYVFPTANSIAVFIKGIHVDLAHRIDFKESLPKIPVYGYNDTDFSAVMASRKLVQGFLVINFTYPGYLSVLLQHHKSKKLMSDNKTKSASDATVDGFVFNELPPNTPEGREARAEYIANLLTQRPASVGRPGFLSELKATSTQIGTRQRYKEALIDKFTEIAPTKRLKEVTSPILSDLGSIDMEVYYANPESALWYIKLRDVHFTDISQSNSAAGAEGSSEPIFETYEFIARSRDIVHVS